MNEQPRKTDGEPDGRSLDVEILRVGLKREFGEGEAGKVKAVAAIQRDVLNARRNGKSSRLVEPSFGQYQNPDDVVYKHEEVGHIAMVAGERQMARLARGYRESRRHHKRHQTAP